MIGAAAARGEGLEEDKTRLQRAHKTSSDTRAVGSGVVSCPTVTGSHLRRRLKEWVGIEARIGESALVDENLGALRRTEVRWRYVVFRVTLRHIKGHVYHNANRRELDCANGIPF